MIPTEQYYQQQAIPPGSSSYYSILFTPSPWRAAIKLHIALWNEIRNIPLTCSDPGIARLKCHWWLEEIAKMEHQTATHPITQQLTPLLDLHQLPITHYQAWVHGTLQLLDTPHFSSNEQLLQFCENTQGKLLELIGMITSQHDPAVITSASNFGIALQLFYLLRHTRQFYRKEIIYLPSNELTTPALLAEPRISHELKDIFQHHAAKIRQFYQNGLTTVHNDNQHLQIFNLLITKLKMKLLAEIAADEYQVLQKQYYLTPLRKMWTAWREWRKINNPKCHR